MMSLMISVVLFHPSLSLIVETVKCRKRRTSHNVIPEFGSLIAGSRPFGVMARYSSVLVSLSSL